MTPEIARNALLFLTRADLKGSEVPAYMEVFTKLQTIASEKPDKDDKPKKGSGKRQQERKANETHQLQGRDPGAA